MDIDDSIKQKRIRFSLKKVKTRISSRNRLTATGTRVSCGITQFYLSSDRGDIPAIIPAEAGTRFAVPLKVAG